MLTLLFFAALHFQKVTVADLAAGRVHMTRAEITGTVTLVKKEQDGDLHFRVSDGKAFVVCECMPKLPCEKPTLGQKVRVQGITRFDGQHKWFELHPVESVEVQP